MEQQESDFSKQYSEESFWEKIRKYALIAGKEVIEKALQLYYALQQKETPMWAKAIIIGALGYLISPVDAILDITPVVGYADDLGVLVAAVATVATSITPEVKKLAEDKLKEWFGN